LHAAQVSALRGEASEGRYGLTWDAAIQKSSESSAQFQSGGEVMLINIDLSNLRVREEHY